MKNILLIPNITKDKDYKVTRRVADLLTDLGAVLYIDEKYNDFLYESVTYVENLPDSLDLAVVIGGDGSMLDASGVAVCKNIPLLGVNLGKLGYLTELDVDNIDSLRLLFEGKYTVEEKMLLDLSLKTKNQAPNKPKRLAVNDIIISHDNFLGIAEFTLMQGEYEKVKYRADGLICSTPAGSTAYSLSAGGPIVSHGINAILVTPIAPHSFFNRSIIFSENDILTVKNDGASELKISIDGRLFSTLPADEECVISVSEKKLKVLTFNPNNTFSTLFKKMKILEDIK